MFEVTIPAKPSPRFARFTAHDFLAAEAEDVVVEFVQEERSAGTVQRTMNEQAAQQALR